jgi:4-amino-4-deoxy-L-arabinose transferase-like glycosyltransferase
MMMIRDPANRWWELWQSPVWRWGRWSLLGFLGLRLIFWGMTFPNPDEAYYWLWGQHWDWSYYDHPGFQAWGQGLLTALLGRSRLALRLSNLLSNIILVVTLYRITTYLYGPQARDRFWLVLLLLVASPLFFLFLALAWPDHWLITFSLLSSFYLVRFADTYVLNQRGSTADLMAAAGFLGLAGLCKYTALLLGLSFAVILLSQRSLRRLYLDPRLYLALGLLTLVLSPIALWNWQHDFFSWRFYMDRTSSTASDSVNWLQPLIFLGLCSLILGPIHTWAIARQAVQPASTPVHQRRASIYPKLAWCLFGLSTGGFMALSLVSAALYYWNILAYPLLFPLLSDQFYRPAQAGLDWRRRPVAIAQGLGLFTAMALILHYNLIPITAGFGPADNDTAALYGWSEISSLVRQATANLDRPLLLTTDYRSAAALAYSLNNPEVIALSGRLDQFDFWYQSDEMEGRDGLLLGETWHPICPAHLAMFDHTGAMETLEIRRFGQVLQTYTLILGYGFRAGPREFPLDPAYPLGFTTDGETCGP